MTAAATARAATPIDTVRRLIGALPSGAGLAGEGPGPATSEVGVGGAGSGQSAPGAAGLSSPGSVAIGPVTRVAGGGPDMEPARQVSARTVCVGESSTRAAATVVTGVADGFVRRFRSCRAEGRYRASLARAAATRGRSDSGTAEMSGSLCRTRYRTASVGPPPNGDSPVAAYPIVTPQTKTSASGPGLPSTCSGAMNPAEPTIMPVLVTAVASRVCAIPKSMTFGPSAARMTLEGFRSLCTTPAAWITVSASASPVASPYSMSAPSGPCRSTYSASEGPSMNSVTMNGTTDSVSAVITRTVHTPLIFVRTDTSRWKRLRNSGSSASSGRSTFTATRPPSPASPRYTTPMPPAPSRAVSR